MAVKIKSNITYQPVVESINRKFVPKAETCHNSSPAGNSAGPVKYESTGWMGGATRMSSRAGLGQCSRNYCVIRANARTTPYSANEIANHERFDTIQAAVRVIIHDLAQITRIQEMWATAVTNPTSKSINGIFAYGYTFKGWVFAVQYAGLKEDPQYAVNTFPSAFDA